MFIFTSNYCVAMDSKVENLIALHLGIGKKIKFDWCVNGLYYFDTANIEHVKKTQDNIADYDKTDESKSSYTGYFFVSTVVKNKKYFSWREMEGVDNARLLQGRIGWTASQDYNQYLISNEINNCTPTVGGIY